MFRGAGRQEETFRMTRMTEGNTPGRDTMLDTLKRQQGEWVSGQILAEKLAMTRTAIWKRIGVLKEQGYGIDASRRKGYRLWEIPDRLLAEEIRDGLKTRVIGQKGIHHFERTDSTNKRAKEVAAAGAVEGTLVVAEEQSRGRGRMERYWFSPAGQGIYVSVILRPALPPSEVTRLVPLTAVAAAETLIEAAGLKAAIKWPNDILVNGKKNSGHSHRTGHGNGCRRLCDYRAGAERQHARRSMARRHPRPGRQPVRGKRAGAFPARCC